MRRPVIVLLLICSSVACKKNDMTAATNFLTSYNLIVCQYQACTSGMSPSAVDAKCSEKSQSEKDAIAVATSGLSGERLRFDSAAAKACLDALAPFKGSACWSESSTRVPIDESAFKSCQKVFVGTLVAGADCYGPYECATGYCDASLEQCPGRCLVGRGEGTGCTADEQCQDELACYAGRCARRVGSGASCLTAPCAEGLSCTTTFTCADIPLGGAGAQCGNSADCAANLFCQYDSHTGAGTCAATVALGAECTSDASCKGRLFCAQNRAGKSFCVVPSDVGQPCITGASSDSQPAARCFGDLFCDPDTNKCTVLPAAGAACFQGRCADDAYCVAGATQQADDMCVTKKPQGEVCKTFSECAGACSYFEGVSGVCVDDLQISNVCHGP